MSVAQTNMRGRGGDPAPLGLLLDKALQCQVEGLDRLPRLSDKADRTAYSAQVVALMRSYPTMGTEIDGERRRRKILDILKEFSTSAPVTVDIPKVVWQYAYASADKIATNRSHWDSSNGPLIAASNATLQKKLGWTEPRKQIERLAEYGFVVPYCLSGNGKRYIRTKSSDRGVDASGWSLAPLLLLEDYLTELSSRERLVREQHMDLPRQITAATRQAYRMLSVLEDGAAVRGRKKLDAIAIWKKKIAGRRVSRQGVKTLKLMAVAAERYLERLLMQLAPSKFSEIPDPRPTRVGVQTHHQYSSESSLVNVTGLAERRSGDVPPSPQREVPSARSRGQETEKIEASADTDEFGVERSGFMWDEAPALFPFISGLIDLGDSPGLDELHATARLARIAPSAAARASGKLGTKVALLCILITGHHLHEGKIRKTPDTYLNALVKRAELGELNIGHTLFGRREALYGRSGTAGRSSVNHIQTRPN